MSVSMVPATQDLVRQVLDDMFGDSPMLNTLSRPSSTQQQPGSVGLLGRMMHIDVVESDRDYVIYCEAPGVPKDHIDISIENSMLTIQVQKDPL
jgi:HSP20 family molecular chaperone IbpA